MKKLSYILVVIASLAMVSCDKVLTKDPLTKFTNDNYWTSEANVELYANYFYSTFTSYGTGGSGDFYFPSLNDNQVGSGFVNWKSTSVDASNSTWNNCYSEIRRANVLLEHLPEVNMVDSKKAKWEGIARLYRALQHYYLVRSFGDCYYVDKVLLPSDEDILYGARQDRDAVMDKVLEDINFAVNNIPSSTSKTEFSKEVAQAIKSEICLYEGTFCKYRTAADNGKAADASRASKYLDECKTACNAIISSSNGYALTPKYVDVYQSFDLSGNKEMIMFKKYDEAASLTHGVVDYCASSTMQKGISRDAFDAFLFLDGECKANTSLNTNDKATFTSVKDADGQDNFLGDLAEVLAVRDPRLSVDIDRYLQYRGTPWARLGTDGKGMPSTSSSGYGVAKFDNLTVDYLHRTTGTKNYTDGPVYWLANILLNYAEACAETNEGAKAIAAVNQIRKRAGMPEIVSEGAIKADPANNMGISNLLWEVRRERRIELMYDNDDRYWCLIRWHQLDKLDEEKYPAIIEGAWIGDNVIKDNHPQVNAEGYITIKEFGIRKYEARQYLRPIPSGQKDYNPQIGQNPGW